MYDNLHARNKTQVQTPLEADSLSPVGFNMQTDTDRFSIVCSERLLQ